MIFEKEWTSHIPLLIKVMDQSEGPVLELGSGPGSTPLLYWLCFDTDRKFYSFDTNKEYAETMSRFGTKLVSSYDDIDVGNDIDVLFIDSAPPERRHIDAARFANHANYIVVHDSQRHLDRYFHYKSIYGLFKYKYKYGKVKPHTTVLSNFKEFAW